MLCDPLCQSGDASKDHWCTGGKKGRREEEEGEEAKKKKRRGKREGKKGLN